MDTEVAGTSARPVTPLGILAAKLQRLDEEVAALPGVDPGLKVRVRAASEMARGLDPYVRACTTPESPALEHLARQTEAEDWSVPGEIALEREMLSGHVEGQFLKLLVHVTRARRVLEIGLFTGYSALAMAEALPDGGELVACEVDPHAAEVAQRCFQGVSSATAIVVELAPAQLTLHRLVQAGEPFDLIFIDADKQGYREYLDTVLDGHLLTADGLICVDNTLLQGEPYLPGPASDNGAAIAAFNRAVADDRRIEQVLIPLRDGLTLIRRVR